MTNKSSLKLTQKLLTSPAQPFIEALDWINPLLISFYSLFFLVIGSNSSQLTDQIFFGLTIPILWIAFYLATHIKTETEKAQLKLDNFYTIVEILLLAIFVWQVSGLSHLTIAAIIGVLVSSFMRASLSVVIASFVVTELMIVFKLPDSVTYLRQSTYLETFLLAVLCSYLIILSLKALQVSRQISRTKLVSALASASVIDRDYKPRDNLNQLPIAALATDETGKIIYINQLATKLFDSPKKPVKSLADLKISDQNNSKLDLSKFLISKNTTLSNTLISQDKQLKPFKISINCDSDGYYLLYFLAIDDSKTTDLKLDQLESLVADAQYQAHLVHQKSETITKLSDLNTDRNVLQKHNLELNTQAQTLKNKLTNIEAFASAGAGVDQAVDVNLRDYANQLYKQYSSLAEAKELEFNLDLAPRLAKTNLPKTTTDQILNILIDNAITHTKTGSVTLHITQNADQTTFSVKDTGNGISKANQEQVKKMISAFASRKTLIDKKASLAIAGYLARTIQAELELTSRLYHGSTFSLTVPNQS